MLLVLLYEIPSLMSSWYRANGLFASRTICVSCLFYFFTRLAIRTARQLFLVCVLIAGGGVVLCWVAMSQFHQHVQGLKAVGLLDIVAFRSRLISPPSPWVLGEWFTVLLLTVPFAVGVPVILWSSRWRLLTVLSTALPLLIVSALFLSSSRSMFWSVAVFGAVTVVVTGLYRIVSVGSALILTAGVSCALGVVLLTEDLLFPGIAEAYTGRQISQVRSTEGRLAIWRRSANVFLLSPVWGVGSGNAPLFLTSSSDQDGTTGFASRTFSLPVQVLTEKGAVGTGLYLAVLALAGWEAHRKLRQPRVSLQSKMLTCCLAAGILALLFRELTYSSLLEHPATAMLFTLNLALVTIEETS
jgi:O-antigen ligase